jgi:eukaryotic-like serine/threonine-protein kinase
MGEVWAGVRLSDNLDVAIKVLLAHAVDANEVIARFRREAQVLARVRSKYVAQVLDFLAEEDGFVLVMELIPGDSLHAVLSYDQTLAIETTLDIVSDVLRGLRDLHNANIVHRDLKPGNIVLRPRPGLRPRATLIDFGVSRIMSDPDEEEITAITRGDRVLGTLEYMAPEQILGSRSVTGTADLYAVGAMMYRAVTGHHVFGDLQEGLLAVAKLNEDAPALDVGRTDEIAERTKVLISRLLSRRLRDRFKTAEEALAEVDSIRALVPDRRPDEQSLSLDEEQTLDKPKKLVTAPAETSRSGPQIEIVNIRAAVPIDEVMVAEPASDPSGQPDTPMGAEVPSYQPPRRAQAEPSALRTIAVAAALFVFGSVGGGLFGVSYARGGLAFQLIQTASGGAATAATSSSVPPPPPPPAPVSVPIEPPEPAPPPPPASSVPVIDVAEVGIGAPDAEPDVAAPEPTMASPIPPPPAPPKTSTPKPPPKATSKPTPKARPPKATSTTPPKATHTTPPKSTKPAPTADKPPEDNTPKQPEALLPEEP